MRTAKILDAVEAAQGEMAADAIEIATDLLDTWRTERLTIAGVTRSVYSLVSGTQSYTIGSGGTFNQQWPASIVSWSIIPDDDATDPIEIPKGRPYTWDEWQAIRIKTSDAQPSAMYYDRQYAAGLGNCLFHPIPNDSDNDVVIYSFVPAIISLVAATSYDLRPAFHRALRLNLAIELADEYGKAVTNVLERRAALALGALKRANIIPVESPIRPEYIIGNAASRRSYNIYTGGR